MNILINYVLINYLWSEVRVQPVFPQRLISHVDTLLWSERHLYRTLCPHESAPRFTALCFNALHKHCAFTGTKVRPSTRKRMAPCQRLRWRTASSAMTSSYVRVYTLFFRHNAVACFIDYSVNITFNCTEKPETLCNSLFAVFTLSWWSETEPSVSPRGESGFKFSV